MDFRPPEGLGELSPDSRTIPASSSSVRLSEIAGLLRDSSLDSWLRDVEPLRKTASRISRWFCRLMSVAFSACFIRSTSKVMNTV